MVVGVITVHLINFKKGEPVVRKCELIEGNPCPDSRQSHEKCPLYDSNGGWCYYTQLYKEEE